MTLSVYSDCHQTGALSPVTEKQTLAVLTHQRKPFALALMIHSGRKFRGGKQHNYDEPGDWGLGTVTSGDQEKEWDDVILYGDTH